MEFKLLFNLLKTIFHIPSPREVMAVMNVNIHMGNATLLDLSTIHKVDLRTVTKKLKEDGSDKITYVETAILKVTDISDNALLSLTSSNETERKHLNVLFDEIYTSWNDFKLYAIKK